MVGKQRTRRQVNITGKTCQRVFSWSCLFGSFWCGWSDCGRVVGFFVCVVAVVGVLRVVGAVRAGGGFLLVTDDIKHIGYTTCIEYIVRHVCYFCLVMFSIHSFGGLKSVTVDAVLSVMFGSWNSDGLILGLIAGKAALI